MENLNVKMSSIRIVVSFFAQTIKFRFLEGTEKGVKLDTKTAKEFAERIYDLTQLPSQLFSDCPFSRHGLKQKMVDSLAMNKDVKAMTSLKDGISILDTIWEQFIAGNFNAASRAAKGETVKLSDMETQFLLGVTNGVTTFEQASALYLQITGKTLPQPVTPEPATETDETITEE